MSQTNGVLFSITRLDKVFRNVQTLYQTSKLFWTNVSTAITYLAFQNLKFRLTRTFRTLLNQANVYSELNDWDSAVWCGCGFDNFSRVCRFCSDNTVAVFVRIAFEKCSITKNEIRIHLNNVMNWMKYNRKRIPEVYSVPYPSIIVHRKNIMNGG